MRLRFIAIISLISLLLAGTIVPGCLQAGTPAAEGLKKFNSPDELDQYVRQHASQNAFGTDMVFSGGGIALKESSNAIPMPAAISGPGRAGQVSGTSTAYDAGHDSGSADYSQTNVQVAGVDEADFVKNDGKYIYLVSNGQLVIVDAYPGSAATIVSRTDFEGTPSNIFINGDRLIVFCQDYSGATDGTMRGNSGFIPAGPSTRVYIYSVADRSQPELLNEYVTGGSYFDSRMIGDYVYFITKTPVLMANDHVTAPVILAGQKLIATPDVYYFDHPEQQFVFHTISSISLNNPDHIDSRTFLLGYSDVLYVSEKNMYISYPKPVNYEPVSSWTYDLAGLIPHNQGVPQAVPDLSDPAVMDKFNRMTEQEKQSFIADIQDRNEKLEKDRTSTVIHKFSIDQGAVRYINEGVVKGNLLNQFSMDEYQGNLRVATTSDVTTQGSSYQYNNVVVLDPDMKQEGILTHLAMNEKIYSARFVNDRLYLVTFKRMDPFFVIDLSDPAVPKVLGKLKIPGFSDYLHPYDSTHIIGVGKETGTNSWGGVSTRGVKIALFDVSDVDHPKQLSHYEIGGPGSDSPALTDHRAFLFSKEKNILVIPVRVTGEVLPAMQSKGMVPPYQSNIWQGAYVFSVTPANGIQLKGKISHAVDNQTDTWYGSPYEIKRSLYIGDELSTISERMIKINDLNDLNTTITSIELENDDYPQVPNYPAMIE